MKKIILLLIVSLLFVSCEKTKYVDYASVSDYYCGTSTDFWTASRIYFDSYEIMEDGKYMFYDKDGKYAGEIYPYEGFFIKRNSYKKVAK